MPEHRRVLEPRHGDVHDPRRRLHARLLVLRRGARPAGGGRHRRAGARRRRHPARSTSTTSSSRRSIATTWRTAARRSSPRRSARRARGCRDCRIEVLIPDFQGNEAALRTVLDARPDVLNHNTETVPRLYRMARSGGRYARTLELLDRSRRYAPDIPTKTGVMVGLGEEHDELVATLQGSARRRLRDPDDRPVPAAVARARADGPLLPSGRIPRAQSRSRSSWASSTSNPARSCAAPTTRTKPPTPTRPPPGPDVRPST